MGTSVVAGFCVNDKRRLHFLLLVVIVVLFLSFSVVWASYNNFNIVADVLDNAVDLSTNFVAVAVATIPDSPDEGVSKKLLKNKTLQGFCCDRVEVVGLFHSGTNWLKYNLKANLKGISITHGNMPRKRMRERTPIWKHSFLSKIDRMAHRSDLLETTFFVVLVKHPVSWVESLARRPFELTQVYEGHPSRTVFNWPELEKLNISRKSGAQGVFNAIDLLKPLLLRVTDERPLHTERNMETDSWMVFSSAMAAWDEFYRSWLVALGWVEAGQRDVATPKNWHGVFVSYRELVKDPVKQLTALEDMIREHVRGSPNKRNPIWYKTEKSRQFKWKRMGKYQVMTASSILSQTGLSSAQEKYLTERPLDGEVSKIVGETMGLTNEILLQPQR